MNLKSPFPGMNPYLEHPNVWRDFHDSLLPALRDELMVGLPDHYVCQIEEQVYVHEFDAAEGRFIGLADVAVQPVDSPPGSASVAEGWQAGPVQVELLVPTELDRSIYLEIRTGEGNQLVTVIELLSPTNKRPGKDREQYLAKRTQLLQGPAHLVEIDLLRKWPRMPGREIPPCDYCILVSHANKRPIADVWPFTLTDAIPSVPIPLLEQDIALKINLQAVIDQLFVRAGYARSIYKRDPDPPLTPAQAAWAAKLLSE